MDMVSLKAACSGKWEGILNNLGINVEYKKRTPCMSCGGRDRFLFDDKHGNGDYYCQQCGNGDAFDLIQKCLGIDFKETIKRVAEVVGMTEDDKRTEKPQVDAKKMLTELWQSSVELSGSDMVTQYLHSRKLTLAPDNVRFCPKCYESDTKGYLPAMVAKISNKSGKPVSIHRTYLQDGKKADIKSPKKMMPGMENLGGGAVRLFQPGGMFEKDSLGVAEGIETAIAATQMWMVATWACLSNTILETFEPPEGIKKIVIFSDNDANFVGQSSAYKLAKRLFQKDLIVNVFQPDLCDWNDQLTDGMLKMKK